MHTISCIICMHHSRFPCPHRVHSKKVFNTYVYPLYIRAHIHPFTSLNNWPSNKIGTCFSPIIRSYPLSCVTEDETLLQLIQLPFSSNSTQRGSAFIFACLPCKSNQVHSTVSILTPDFSQKQCFLISKITHYKYLTYSERPPLFTVIKLSAHPPLWWILATHQVRSPTNLSKFQNRSQQKYNFFHYHLLPLVRSKFNSLH